MSKRTRETGPLEENEKGEYFNNKKHYQAFMNGPVEGLGEDERIRKEIKLTNAMQSIHEPLPTGEEDTELVEYLKGLSENKGYVTPILTHASDLPESHPNYRPQPDSFSFRAVDPLAQPRGGKKRKSNKKSRKSTPIKKTRKSRKSRKSTKK